MCGIIGIIGSKSIISDLIFILENLEYRGYDSAGIATVYKNALYVYKSIGNLNQLKLLLNSYTKVVKGKIGIGHTRWATHGAPTKLENAHPIVTHKVSVVHNGIIENYQQLKDELMILGIKFQSDTDTEVIAHLITVNIENGMNIFEACRTAALKLKGSFAIVVISKEFPDTLIGFKRNMPLIVGIGNEEKVLYIASDAIAISQFVNNVIYLDDQQIAEIKLNGKFKINNFSGSNVKFTLHHIEQYKTHKKDDFATFMQKEIYEQCYVLKNILNSHQRSNIDWKNIDRIYIVACGSSNYAGYTAKYLIEKDSNMTVDIDIASEFTTRKPKIRDDTLYLFISQSGETADTISALNYVIQYNAKTACITNVAYSTLGRFSQYVIKIKAGPEVAVAATKTFTAQLLVLLLLSFEINNNKSAQKKLIKELQLFNTAFISDIEANIKKITHLIKSYDRFLYIGRGVMYPICLEGALKTRELSYTTAIGVAAGELKHGSIALVDSKTLIIALVPHDATYVKMSSTIQEVNARGGDILLISDKNCLKHTSRFCKYSILLQNVDILKPILYSLPLQLIAYHVAIARGCNVDKPRNLAKSVTVE